MSEHRTEDEQTTVAMAMLDGMADLWFAESGFTRLNFPEPVVRMIKQAHLEGLYAGRCSNVDIAQAKERERCAKAAEAAVLPDGFQWGRDAMEQFNFGKKRCAEAIRSLQPVI